MDGPEIVAVTATLEGAMLPCIWCKKESSDTTLEHIIPEPLGCPEDLFLTDGAVCRSCNNNLGHLDKAVIDEFDIPAYMTGVPRKGGKRPQIDSRGNMLGTWDASGKVLAINMGRHPVSWRDGRRVGAFGKSMRNIKATIRRAGEVVDVSFNVRLGDSPKFVRGIVKIAFSSLAYFLSPRTAAEDQFDSIRDFVIDGQGDRKILLVAASDRNYTNQVWPPLRNDNGDYAIEFRLVRVNFCVDLSSGMKVFGFLKEKARELYRPDGWTYLPL